MIKGDTVPAIFVSRSDWKQFYSAALDVGPSLYDVRDLFSWLVWKHYPPQNSSKLQQSPIESRGIYNQGDFVGYKIRQICECLEILNTLLVWPINFLKFDIWLRIRVLTDVGKV